MRIFVTGGSGFLGRAIVGRLLGDGHRVTSLLLPGDDSEPDGRCDVVRGDITRADTLQGLLNGHSGVLHLAGAVGYGQTWRTCIRLNREGSRNVALEAARAGARRFVHMSSVSVYGRVPFLPVDEETPLKKIGDPYGDTKIDAETVIRETAGRRELDLTVIRPTVIYGPGDLLFLPKLLENLERGAARLIGGGGNTVNLIHVDDVAEFVALVFRTEAATGRVYNLTHPENPTWKELFNAVAATLGIPAPAKSIPYRAAYLLAGLLEFVSRITRKPPRITRYAVRNVGRQYHYVTDRMQQELGFAPSIPTLQGVCDCARKQKGAP